MSRPYPGILGDRRVPGYGPPYYCKGPGKTEGVIILGIIINKNYRN